ncbi:MAG: S-layer homology domain-containing protein [Nostoc sp. NMS1]|uniref:fasciclin domain-containing protein n=1 Tax=unclassified Nostoc TaxID=2593658 RepID=UPI0025DA87D3|nr:MULTISPECIES: fasciclin domain-containing protein [unclassified Nostoc]MBN3908847.1 S-layer homology domain-containing protein [Nostoc sp. NMS1]MBN3990750.1 S-layer homology domain-containing protein [Nostoc sp. NMS2]
MFSFFRWPSARVALLVVGMTAATITPIVISTPASSQSTVPSDTPSPATPSPATPSATPSPTSTVNLSDVSSDYWARPFIQALADNNVIAGFPDGSFRPNQAVTRAEFAALIQKAFPNQNRIRQLSAGGFRDVPAGYWASSVIQYAYETGFLAGYPGNVFSPNQQIPKVQALVALTSGLGLTASSTGTSTDLNTYYTDASSIPQYAVASVTSATQSNIVVNYPDVKQLNPQQPLTRAEAAALLYQALAKQGRVQPIASNLPASQYVVGGTQTGSDIVTLASSSSSLTTLTSLLKTAGLTDVLQQPGPYTVFAPTDQAFAALPAATLQQLQQPENRQALIKILTYHVVPGAVTSSQLTAGELKTAEEKPVNIQIDRASNQISVNNARVIQADVKASNGVIHAINQVLVPPDVNISQLNQPPTGNADGTTPAVTPGRTTLGGPSYIGVAGNIGLSGNDTALSDGNFAVISKIGLTRNISVRPSVLFGDNTEFLVPLTLDFRPRAAGEVGSETFSISPFIGAGVAIEVNNDTDFGLLLTGGVDVPLGSRFTVTGSVNAAFMDQTDVGLLLGLGYNF